MFSSSDYLLQGNESESRHRANRGHLFDRQQQISAAGLPGSPIEDKSTGNDSENCGNENWHEEQSSAF
jgi:hypothetical protein